MGAESLRAVFELVLPPRSLMKQHEFNNGRSPISQSGVEPSYVEL